MYTEKLSERPFQNSLKLFSGLKIKGDMKFSKFGQIIIETANYNWQITAENGVLQEKLNNHELLIRRAFQSCV